MAGDDLNDPLGWRPDAPPPPPRRIAWRAIGIGVGCAGVAAISALAWYKNTGMGGEPFAIAKIERLPARDTAGPAPTAAAAGIDTMGAMRVPANRAAGDVEAESGVRVVRSGGGQAPGALIIQVPDTLGVQLAPAPDRRLVDKGKFGPLPKIAADGSRAADVYARPLMTSTDIKPGAPRIALVVGGMGLSAQATQNAVSRLPGPVTLAFAPYGPDLEKQVARAREAGHEVLLQAPMQGFDAGPAPGPHMLETGAAPEQTLEHLHWLMSRFAGYIGIGNFLGAKFTANDAALTPVLREVFARGLIYFDDGTSAQSRAQSVAAAMGGGAMRADVVIDLVQKPEAIEAELAKLERIARQKGSAIGVAAGLPATVDQVARFARGLEKRGIALAPLSSLATGRVAPNAGNAR